MMSNIYCFEAQKRSVIIIIIIINIIIIFIVSRPERYDNKLIAAQIMIQVTSVGSQDKCIYR